MPSSYTTNGGIELPANGEQSATWGNTVNDNMEIIDRLTNGVGSITLSGTTHTLTTSNGALSEGQYSVLVLGGSPSGTNTVTVSPSDAQHVYIVKNASGQTATFTQGSGSNVSVEDGTTKIIYCDGAGSGAAVVDITGSLDFGTLIVGGTTVTATGAELNILDGVTATTAELNILDGVTATTAELNIMDGVTATTAEINTLDGFTGSVADLNYAKDLRATGVTTGEFDKLDGLTATTAELNIMDGVTATTAEINKLDGVTATTAELNYVDGVTSNIQTQLNAKYEAATQTEATWEAGTSTTESLVSPAKVKAAVEANTPSPVMEVIAAAKMQAVNVNPPTTYFDTGFASIARQGTGQYRFTFTTPRSSVDYVVSGLSQSTTSRTPATNSFDVNGFDVDVQVISSGGYTDQPFDIIVHALPS